MGNNVIIAAVGDLCLGDHYFSLGHGTGSVCKQYGIEKIFKNVKKRFADCDIVFGNLESPLSNVSSQKDMVERKVFRGEPSFASGLSEIGFNILNIANNHILQHGVESFNETIACLKNNGIFPLGLKCLQKFSCLPIIIEKRSVPIGFLGYSLVKDQYYSDQTLYASGTIETIIQDVTKLSSEVELLIVSVHFGDEGVSLPSPVVIKTARLIADAGARVILGHHPHVFQPVEKYKNCLIFYSLGNFVFDLFWSCDLIQSALVRIIYDRSTNNLSYQIDPVVLTQDYELVFMAPSESALFMSYLDRNLNILHGMAQENYIDYYRRLLQEKRGVLQRSKLWYFALNFPRGESALKASFLINKIKNKLIRIIR